MLVFGLPWRRLWARLAESFCADGEYVGSAEGFNGPLTVKVTVSGGTVTDVEVTAHSDTLVSLTERSRRYQRPSWQARLLT